MDDNNNFDIDELLAPLDGPVDDRAPTAAAAPAGHVHTPAAAAAGNVHAPAAELHQLAPAAVVKGQAIAAEVQGQALAAEVQGQANAAAAVFGDGLGHGHAPVAAAVVNYKYYPLANFVAWPYQEEERGKQSGVYQLPEGLYWIVFDHQRIRTRGAVGKNPCTANPLVYWIAKNIMEGWRNLSLAKLKF